MSRWHLRIHRLFWAFLNYSLLKTHTVCVIIKPFLNSICTDCSTSTCLIPCPSKNLLDDRKMKKPKLGKVNDRSDEGNNARDSTLGPDVTQHHLFLLCDSDSLKSRKDELWVTLCFFSVNFIIACIGEKIPVWVRTKELTCRSSLILHLIYKTFCERLSCYSQFGLSLSSSQCRRYYQSLNKRRWHSWSSFYRFGSNDSAERRTDSSVIRVDLAGTLLMPAMWRDLSAWPPAVENIHMKHVICPALVTTISPVMRALHRLMAFSDGTRCFSLSTAVGLLSPFWCPSISLSFLFTCSLFLSRHISFSHFLNIWGLSNMLLVLRVKLPCKNRVVNLHIPNNIPAGRDTKSPAVKLFSILIYSNPIKQFATSREDIIQQGCSICCSGGHISWKLRAQPGQFPELFLLFMYTRLEDGSTFSEHFLLKSTFQISNSKFLMQ